MDYPLLVGMLDGPADLSKQVQPFRVERLIRILASVRSPQSDRLICLAEASVFPSGEKATVQTILEWPRSLSTSWLLVVQSLTVPSLPPVARRRSSAAKARGKMSATETRGKTGWEGAFSALPAAPDHSFRCGIAVRSRRRCDQGCSCGLGPRIRRDKGPVLSRPSNGLHPAIVSNK
jgi:hypothetical protein